MAATTIEIVRPQAPTSLTFTYQPHFLPSRRSRYNTSKQPAEVYEVEEVWDLENLVIHNADQETLFDDLQAGSQGLWGEVFGDRTDHPTEIRYRRGATTEFSMSTTTHEDLRFEVLRVLRDVATGQTIWRLNLRVVGTLKLADASGFCRLDQSFSVTLRHGFATKTLTSDVSVATGTDITGKATTSAFLLSKPSKARWIRGSSSTADMEEVEGRDKSGDTSGLRSARFVHAYEEIGIAMPAGVHDVEKSIRQALGVASYEMTLSAVGSGARDWIDGELPENKAGTVLEYNFVADRWTATLSAVGVNDQDVVIDQPAGDDPASDRPADRPQRVITRGFSWSGGGLGPLVYQRVPGAGSVPLRLEGGPVEVRESIEVEVVGPTSQQDFYLPAPVLDQAWLIDGPSPGEWRLKGPKAQDAAQDVWICSVEHTYLIPNDRALLPNGSVVFTALTSDEAGGWRTQAEWLSGVKSESRPGVL